jgi:hypothetical protein
MPRSLIVFALPYPSFFVFLLWLFHGQVDDWPSGRFAALLPSRKSALGAAKISEQKTHQTSPLSTAYEAADFAVAARAEIDTL